MKAIQDSLSPLCIFHTFIVELLIILYQSHIYIRTKLIDERCQGIELSHIMPPKRSYSHSLKRGVDCGGALSTVSKMT